VTVVMGGETPNVHAAPAGRPEARVEMNPPLTAAKG